MNPNSPDLTQVMDRLRLEARAQQRRNEAAADVPAVELPAPADPLPPPPRVSANPVANAVLAWTTLADLAARARRKVMVGDWLPLWLRPLARNQGGFNGILLEAVERLAEGNAQLQEQIETLRADLQAQSAWQAALSRARESEREWMQAAEPHLLRVLAESHAHRKRAEKEELRVALLEEQSNFTRNDVDQLASRAGHYEALGSDLDHRLSRLQSQADEQAGRLQGAIAQVDRAGKHLGQLAERLADLQRQAPVWRSDDQHLAEQLASPASGEYERHALDAFCLAFENRFRGSRETVIESLRVHLAALEEARAGGADRPVLDLGCGRGEWLELLREAGMSAAGVDPNASMIDQCRERGLNVEMAEPLKFLRGQPDASRGAVTAFHLIERLSSAGALIELVRECHRVLQPGGVLILESANPENLVAGATECWGDFSRQRLVLPSSAGFLIEQAGFVQVRIERLHPVGGEARAEPPGGGDAAIWERVRALLDGPRDYAVAGTKACTS